MNRNLCHCVEEITSSGALVPVLHPLHRRSGPAGRHNRCSGSVIRNCRVWGQQMRGAGECSRVTKDCRSSFSSSQAPAQYTVSSWSNDTPLAFLCRLGTMKLARSQDVRVRSLSLAVFSLSWRHLEPGPDPRGHPHTPASASLNDCDEHTAR